MTREKTTKRRPRKTAAVVLSGLGLAACTLLTPLPDHADLDARLGAFPTHGLPLRKPVTIYWNDHQVPFIEAETDHDAALALGLAHAHLRLGQMEILRRVSQGRISEMAGPLTTDIDHSLRILNFGRAAPAMIAAMPEDTRAWMEAFVGGINHYLANARALPHEFAVLGLEREPWTVADLLTLGRLASSDVNWLLWFQVLKLRQRPDWPDLWRRMVALGADSVPSFEADGFDDHSMLDDILGGLGRSGSNTIAVAGGRGATGSALIASDPHLGIQLPNFWLLAGYKSPSYHVVGLMIPGLPFVALGRNPWIAWGGSNMRAASSDLYDVSALAPEEITERRETIRVRWWFDHDVTLRDTALGPIVSDAPALETAPGEVLALRWMGHRPSREVTAMLALNQARDWDGFLAAMDEFAVPGQNMLYADVDGHIGQAMAVHLPRREPEPPDKLVRSPAAAGEWDHVVTARALPARHDPPEGFLASANNRPARSEIPVGYFFSLDDRIRRIKLVLENESDITVNDLNLLQTDVYMISSVEFRDALLARLRALPLQEQLEPSQGRVVDLLADWDGHYTARSAGALAFELFLHRFVETFYGDGRLAPHPATNRVRAMIAQDVAAAEAEPLAGAIEAALTAVAGDLEEHDSWGDMHRLGLGHPLRYAPLIGRRYRFADLPSAGGSHTLMKTAHRITAERHDASYGSNARHISDLSDPDANYFVLLGGQDGWLNSTTFMDQVKTWRRGEYMRIPLRPETARADFAHHMTLTPANGR